MVNFVPFFSVHWPLYVEDELPDDLPVISEMPTLTEYVPSALMPTVTLASVLPWPVVSVRLIKVPDISFQVFPRSHEFFSVDSVLSREVIVISTLALATLFLVLAAPSVTSTFAAYSYVILNSRSSTPFETREVFLLSLMVWRRIYVTVPVQAPEHFDAKGFVPFF